MILDEKLSTDKHLARMSDFAELFISTTDYPFATHHIIAYLQTRKATTNFPKMRSQDGADQFPGGPEGRRLVGGSWGKSSLGA